MPPSSRHAPSPGTVWVLQLPAQLSWLQNRMLASAAALLARAARATRAWASCMFLGVMLFVEQDVQEILSRVDETLRL